MNRLALQQGLLALAFYRQSRLPRSLAIGTRAASTIAETSFWKQLVPKPLRASARGSGSKKTKSTQGWNPATYFIVMFLFIGSMSIQMIALKRDFSTFMRQSDVRIGLLKEVVEKLQRGEEVDVEKALGTGDPEKELAWEDVLKEIERGEVAPKQRKKQPEPRQTPNAEAAAPPAQEPPRVKAQSILAEKGFF